MPLILMSINKRHVPLNNSLNGQHCHFISPDNYPFYSGFCWYLLALHQLLSGEGWGQIWVRSIRGQEEDAIEAMAQFKQCSGFFSLRSWSPINVWLAEESQRTGLLHLPKSRAIDCFHWWEITLQGRDWFSCKSPLPRTVVSTHNKCSLNIFEGHWVCSLCFSGILGATDLLCKLRG